jgi:Putative prokaryotic signal transducing protein
MADRDQPVSGPVLIFSTAEIDLLAVARSVLQSAEIPFVVQGDHALGQLPTGVLAGPFARHGLAARIFVPASRAQEARDLLAHTVASPEDDE